jgi:hypothetical protein
MGLREFVDDRGVAWKVWDVRAETMHPKTAAELFLGDYQEGWLAFESATERRRLAQFPDDWDRAPRERLLALLAAAAVIPPRGRRGTVSGEYRRFAERESRGRHERDATGGGQGEGDGPDAPEGRRR